MAHCPTLVIAGTHSGSGKTSLTLAMARALARKGIAVQTFKVGPDFLDPTYLSLASGRPCYNLDGWMGGKDHVRRLFERTTADADVALIEGVMGLFDGADPETSEGSTAEIARWLGAPILLVVNVHGMARSLAAVVKGFTEFERGLGFAGIVANHCGSERHAAWLADSLKAAALPPLAGALPRGGFPELASRHLGLVTADQGLLPGALLDAMANTLEQHLPLESLLPGVFEKQTGKTTGIPSVDMGTPYLSFVTKDKYGVPISISPAVKGTPGLIRIGVARDAAFHFYYQALFDALDTAGCEVRFFSPLSDSRLPEGISGLYLGGGYPEAHAAALAANGEMLLAIPGICSNRTAPLCRMRGADVPLRGAPDGQPLPPLPGDSPGQDEDAQDEADPGLCRGRPRGRFHLGPPGRSFSGPRIPLLGAGRQPGGRSGLADGLFPPAAPLRSDRGRRLPEGGHPGLLHTPLPRGTADGG